MYLLDEMLLREYILPIEYQTLNNILAQSLPRGPSFSEEEEEEEEEKEEEMEIVDDVENINSFNNRLYE